MLLPPTPTTYSRAICIFKGHRHVSKWRAQYTLLVVCRYVLYSVRRTCQREEQQEEKGGYARIIHVTRLLNPKGTFHNIYLLCKVQYIHACVYEYLVTTGLRRRKYVSSISMYIVEVATRTVISLGGPCLVREDAARRWARAGPASERTSPLIANEAEQQTLLLLCILRTHTTATYYELQHT